MINVDRDPLERPRLYTVEEAARLLYLSRTGVYGLIRNGEIRSVRVGGRRLVPRHIFEQVVSRLLDTT